MGEGEAVKTVFINSSTSNWNKSQEINRQICPWGIIAKPQSQYKEIPRRPQYMCVVCFRKHIFLIFVCMLLKIKSQLPVAEQL